MTINREPTALEQEKIRLAEQIGSSMARKQKPLSEFLGSNCISGLTEQEKNAIRDSYTKTQNEVIRATII